MVEIIDYKAFQDFSVVVYLMYVYFLFFFHAFLNLSMEKYILLEIIEPIRPVL